MVNICKYQEYFGISRKLSRDTKYLNVDICKISLRKNLINLNPLTSFSMKHVRLTEQLFGYCSVKWSLIAETTVL